MAMRALPQQLCAAVAATHADVRIEIEDCMLGELAVPVDERRRILQLPERAPDRAMNAQRVRVLHERGEKEIKCLARMSAGCQMAGEREPRAPVLRILFDEP